MDRKRANCVDAFATKTRDFAHALTHFATTLAFAQATGETFESTVLAQQILEVQKEALSRDNPYSTMGNEKHPTNFP